MFKSADDEDPHNGAVQVMYCIKDASQLSFVETEEMEAAWEEQISST